MFSKRLKTDNTIQQLKKLKKRESDLEKQLLAVTFPSSLR